MKTYIKNLITAAGATALSYFGHSRSQLKRDGSIVTDADRAVEEMLRAQILIDHPGSVFIGEETDSPTEGDLVWVIDPIDGTAMYSVGGFTWTISIAVFHKRVPICAAVYCPPVKELFFADKDGFEVNGVTYGLRGFEISNRNVLYVPSNFARDYRIVSYDGKTRNLGSGCLHIAYVAAQRGDATLLRGHLWDVAAGFIFVNAIGGIALKLDGSDASPATVIEYGRRKVPYPILFASCIESGRFYAERLTWLNKCGCDAELEPR